ncbi:MAG: LysR family transcriptional regulator [Beijerinckiaceae bacterium]
MDLRQLRFLIKVAESGSISRAAQSLNMAQPSLSQRMSDLESELGAELLHRTRNGVRPTEIGAMVVDRARAIVRLADGLSHDVKNAAAAPVGEVTVGLPTTMALHLTVPLVQRVRAALPSVNLHVTEGMSGHIQEWVLSGRLDIALLYSADPIPGLAMDEILTEDLWLISAAGAHRKNNALRLAAISAFPLVLPGRDHGLRRNIERITLRAGVPLTVAVEVDSLPHMKRLVMDGGLHTILPWAACRDEMAAGQLMARPIARPALRRPVVLVTALERPLSLAGHRIRDLLRALVVHTITARP